MWFNIEASARGLGTPTNQHYREGRYAKSARLEKRAGTLLPLTPRRAFAQFLGERSNDWWESGYFRNSVNCLAWYAELDGFPFSLDVLAHRVLRMARRILVKRMPFKFDHPYFQPPPRRFRLIPPQLEANMVALGILDDLLREYFAFLKTPHWLRKEPLLCSVAFSPNKTFRFNRPWQFTDEFERW